MDWRLSLSEPSLPTGKARVGQRRIWKRNWFNIINQQGWLIGREDLKCLRIHIWDSPGILGGHGRHCKLILGKGVGQRTLPLSGLIPSWVTTLSRRVGTVRLMPGCPQIKKRQLFFFFWWWNRNACSPSASLLLAPKCWSLELTMLEKRNRIGSLFLKSQVGICTLSTQIRLNS